MSPKELDGYINKLTEFSGYTPIIKVQEMATIYYNLIDTKIEKEGKYLKLSFQFQFQIKEKKRYGKRLN